MAELHSPTPVYSVQWQFASLHAVVAGHLGFSLSALGTLESYSFPAAPQVSGTGVRSRPALLALNRVATGVKTTVTRIVPITPLPTSLGVPIIGDGLVDTATIDAARASAIDIQSSLEEGKESEQEASISNQLGKAQSFVSQENHSYAPGLVLFHHGGIVESSSRLTVMMDVARLLLPPCDTELLESASAGTFELSSNLLDGLDLHDTLEAFQAIQNGDIDAAKRIKAKQTRPPASATPSIASDALQTASAARHDLDFENSSPPHASAMIASGGRETTNSDGIGSIFEHTRSRLLVLNLAKDSDIAQSMIQHANHRRSTAAIGHRRSIPRRGEGAVSYP